MKRNTKIKSLENLEAVERGRERATLYKQVSSKINLERIIRQKEKKREGSREKRLKNAGITLIALVITVIVILILAGVSISMIAGNNGVLEKAGQATEAQADAEENEQLKMAVMTAIADDKLGKLTQENVEKEIDNQFGSGTSASKLQGDGPWTYEGRDIYYIGINGEVTGNGDPIGQHKILGTVMEETTKLEDANGDEVCIPAGFKIAEDSATDDNEGIVIEDEEGNQFVWVPCNGSNGITYEKEKGLAKTWREKYSSKQYYYTKIPDTLNDDGEVVKEGKDIPADSWTDNGGD